MLTALGTEEQIGNLELERGFKDEIVKSRFPVTTQCKKTLNVKQPSSYFGDRAKVNKRSLKTVISKPLTSVNQPVITLPKVEKAVADMKPKKFDVGVQSDIDTQMDIKENTSKSAQTPDMLASFLKILEQTKKPPCVENSTNTETAVCSGTRYVFLY